MCGRFTLTAPPQDIKDHFHLNDTGVLKPRYNLAPSQYIPVIRTPGLLEFLTWGLRPSWMKEGHNPFINARAETLADKPSFKSAYKDRRCLIVADGYYEWEQKRNMKQPYYISRPEHKLFAFAGLWDGDTCALITRPDKKPAILTEKEYDVWLNKKSSHEALQECLLKKFSEKFTIYPVSTTVNNTNNDFIECVKSLQ